MASGNKVFRAKVTFFVGRIKVAAGSLVREGHSVMNGVEHLFEELHVDFEREDIAADKVLAAEKAKAEVEVQRLAAEAQVKAEAEAKAAVEAASKVVESDAAKVEKAAS